MSIKKKVLIGLGTVSALGAFSVGTYFISESAAKVKTGGDEIIKPNPTPINPITDVDDKDKDQTEVPTVHLEKGIFNEKNKIKYVALGDSITEGYTGEIHKIIKGTYDETTKELTGDGYPSYFVEYLNKINPKLLKSFSNYAISGSTAAEWYTLLSYFDKNKQENTLVSNDDLSVIFGEKYEEIAKKVIQSIENSNFITVSLGANDAFKLLLSELTKLNWGSIIQTISSSKTLNSDLINIFAPVGNEILKQVKYRMYDVSGKIKEINPNAQIIFLNYPMPMLRIKDVINGLIGSDPNGQNSMKISDVLLNVINSGVKNVLLQNNKNENETNHSKNIHLYNLYDDKYWTENKNLLSPIILDIHPGHKGYKKMAQDLIVALGTNKEFWTQKNLDTYAIKFSESHLKELKKHPKMIDFNLTDEQIIEKAFANNMDADLKSESKLEKTFADRLSNSNNSLDIKWYIESYILHSRNGNSFYAQNMYEMVKNMLKSESVKKVDQEGLIYSFLFDNQSKNFESIIKQFLDSDIIPHLFNNFQKNADTIDLDNNNEAGVQDFTLQILKELAIKSFGDEKTWVDFIKVMLSGSYISEPENKEKLTKIIKILLKNVLITENIQKVNDLLKAIKLPDSVTQIIDQTKIYELANIILTNPEFQVVVNNLAKNSINSTELIVKENTFKGMLQVLLESNKDTISIDLMHMIDSLLKDEKFNTAITSLVIKLNESYKDYVPAEMIQKWFTKLAPIISDVDAKLQVSKVLFDNFYKYILANQFDFSKFNTVQEKIKNDILQLITKENISAILEMILVENKEFVDTNLNELIADVMIVMNKPAIQLKLSEMIIAQLKEANLISNMQDYTDVVQDLLSTSLNNDLNIVLPVATKLIKAVQNKTIDLKNIEIQKIIDVIFEQNDPIFTNDKLNQIIQAFVNSSSFNENKDKTKQFVKEIIGNLFNDKLIDQLYNLLNTQQYDYRTFVDKTMFSNLLNSFFESSELNDVIDLVFNNIDSLKNIDYKEGITKVISQNEVQIKKIIFDFSSKVINDENTKQLLLDVIKKLLLNVSNDSNYMQNVNELIIKLNTDIDTIITTFKAPLLIQNLGYELLNDISSNRKIDILQVFQSTLNLNSQDETLLFIFNSLSKLNIVKDSTNLNVVLKEIVKTLLNDKEALKSILNVLSSDTVAQINKFILVDDLLDLVQQDFKNEIIQISNILVDSALASLKNTQEITTTSGLFKLVLNNTNYSEVIKIIENSLTKLVSNPVVSQKISKLIQGFLVEKQLIANTPENTETIKSLLKLLPIINSKLNVVSPILSGIIETLKTSTNIEEFKQNLEKNIDVSSIISFNNLTNLLSILKEPDFTENKNSIKNLLLEIVNNLWINTELIDQILETININPESSIGKFITTQELKDFIKNQIISDETENSLKSIIHNLITDLLDNTETYTNLNTIGDLINTFISNEKHSAKIVAFVTNQIDYIANNTNIISNLLIYVLNKENVEITLNDKNELKNLVIEALKISKDTKVYETLLNSVLKNNLNIGKLINDLVKALMNKEEITVESLNLKPVLDKTISNLKAFLTKEKIDEILTQIINSDVIYENRNVIKKLIKLLPNSILTTELLQKIYNSIEIKGFEFKTYITQVQFVHLVNVVTDIPEIYELINLFIDNIKELRNVGEIAGIKTIVNNNQAQIKSLLEVIISKITLNKDFKDVVVNAIKIYMTTLSESNDYRLAVEDFTNNISINFEAVVSQLKLNKLLPELSIEIINKINSDQPYDVVQVLNKVFETSNTKELIYALINRVLNTNILDNSNSVKTIIQTLVTKYISDPVELEKIINLIPEKIKLELNKYISNADLASLITNNFSNNISALVSQFTDTILASVSELKTSVSLNDMLKVIVKNLDADLLKTNLNNLILTSFKNDDFIDKTSIIIEKVLKNYNFLDENDTQLNGIKAILKLIPEAENNLKFISPFIDSIIEAIKVSNNFVELEQNFKSNIQNVKFIDINDITHVTKILTSEIFTTSKNDIVSLFNNLIDKFFSNSERVNQLIDTINLEKLLENQNIIKANEIKDFIINDLINDSGSVNLKTIIKDLISDIATRNNEYGDDTSVFELLNTYLNNVNNQTKLKPYIISKVKLFVEKSTILSSILVDTLTKNGSTFSDTEKLSLDIVIKEFIKIANVNSDIDNIINLLFDNNLNMFDVVQTVLNLIKNKQTITINALNIQTNIEKFVEDLKTYFSEQKIQQLLHLVGSSTVLIENKEILIKLIKDAPSAIVTSELIETIRVQLKFDTFDLSKNIDPVRFETTFRQLLGDQGISQIADIVLNNLAEFANKPYKEALITIINNNSVQIETIVEQMSSRIILDENNKQLILGTIKNIFNEMSTEEVYRQHVNTIFTHIDSIYPQIISNLNITKLTSFLSVPLVNQLLGAEKVDIKQVLYKVYEVDNVKDLVVKLLKSASEINLIVDDEANHYVIKEVANSLLSDETKLSKIFELISPEMQVKINQILDFQTLVRLLTTEFKPELLNAISIITDSAIKTFPQIKTVNTVNEILKLWINNIDQEVLINNLNVAIGKILSNSEILESITKNVKDYLIENNLIDDTPEISNGLRQIIEIIPEINQNIQFIRPLITTLFDTLNKNTDFDQFGNELKAAISIETFIDPYNLNTFLNILNSQRFNSNKVDMHTFFKSLIEHIWANEEWATQVINGLDLSFITTDETIITQAQLKEFLIEQIYKDQSPTNLKALFLNVFQDIFTNNTKYASAKSLFEIIKIYLQNSANKTVFKGFINSTLDKIVNQTQILPNFIYNTFKEKDILLTEEDRPIVQDVIKSLFISFKNSTFFTEIIDYALNQLGTYTYTNDYKKDVQGALDNVIGHFLMDGKKVDVNKIVTDIAPKMTEILNNTKFTNGSFTDFINLLFTRSTYSKTQKTGIYKILNDMLTDTSQTETSYNIITMLFNAKTNFQNLIKSLVRPIIESYLDDILKDSTKPFDINTNRSYQALLRLSTTLLWILHKNAGDSAFWNGTSFDVATFVYNGIWYGIDESLKSVKYNGKFTTTVKNKFHISDAYKFTNLIFGNSSKKSWWSSGISNYYSDYIVALVYWNNNNDPYTSGQKYSDRLWYILEKGKKQP